MTIGERIKQCRDSRGWSQQQLAKRAGVSQQLITRLETGKVNETKKIVQLAKAFGMTVDEFIEYVHADRDGPTATASKDVIIAQLQAKIDALMLEYCPQEMTANQRARWGLNQQPTRESTCD